MVVVYRPYYSPTYSATWAALVDGAIGAQVAVGVAAASAAVAVVSGVDLEVVEVLAVGALEAVGKGAGSDDSTLVCRAT